MKNNVIIFILLLSVATNLCAQNTENRFVFFKETFEDNSKGWETVSNPPSESQTIVSVSNKKYKLKQEGHFYYYTKFPIILEELNNTNCFISFDLCYPLSMVKTDEKAPTAGFMWNRLDNDNQHRFQINPFGQYRISNRTKGVWGNSNFQGNSAIEEGRNTNHIEIKIEQSNLKDEVFMSFFVNNQFIEKIPCQNLDLDKCGLFVAGPKAVYEFDNVCIGYLKGLKEIIRDKVENKINAWQQKGEFEKTAEYQMRVNEISREKKIQEIQNEVIQDLKKQFASTVRFNDVTLGTYDADNECFLMQSKELGDFILPVPISEAPTFKEKFTSYQFQNPDFFIHNEKFAISRVELVLPNTSKKYVYNNENKLNYSITNIEYQFDPIELDMQSNESGNAQISTNNITVGKSDVDVNIPVSSVVNDKTFAVVIGNENYKNEIPVKYALNDANTFRLYLEKTLGVPKTNIHHVQNATYGNMLEELQWINDICREFKGKANIIFYYAGHGVPNSDSKQAYLLPQDGNSLNTQTSVKLENVYAKMTEFPSASATVFLDACFSGSGRDVNTLLADGRAGKVIPKSDVLTGNIVVFSATTSNETAYPFHEKQHGMFTYYLLKKIQESNGNATLKEISDYVSTQVGQQSVVVNKDPQHPEVNVGIGHEEAWKSKKMK